jgi:hypothetical protein
MLLLEVLEAQVLMVVLEAVVHTLVVAVERNQIQVLEEVEVQVELPPLKSIQDAAAVLVHLLKF